MWLPDGSVRKRRKAFELRGHAHELTFSCFQKLPLLGLEEPRKWIIESMDRMRAALAVEVWAYVLMPDHVHLIVFPTREDYSVAGILQLVKQSVAQKALNHMRRTGSSWLDRLRRVDPSGSVTYCFWQPGGGYDRNIDRVSTLWEMIDYIHLNPVRRGLVSRSTDWAWSSAKQYAGEDDYTFRVDSPPSR